jgi:hypothetical protein
MTTLYRNELEYNIEPVVTAEGAANRVKLNQLDDNLVPEVLAINEFFDVFFSKNCQTCHLTETSSL